MLAFRTFVVGIFAALLLQTGIAGAQVSDRVVRIGNLDLGPYISVAYIEKIAAKHGIKVQMTSFRRSLELAAAIKAGHMDVGVGGIEAAVAAVASGTPAVIVSSMSNKGARVVGRSDMKWTSIKDVKGKKFATIHGLHELLAKTLFDEHGLTYSDKPGADVQLVFVPNSPNLLNVLKLGEVAATSAPEPFPSRGIVEGYATNIMLPYDTILGTMPRAVYMHQDFHDKFPKEAQAVVDALVEGTKHFRDNPDAARDFALNDKLKGLITPEDWDFAAKNQDWDVRLTNEVVQGFIDQMLKFGMIREKIDAAKITDLSLLDNAMKKVGW